MKGSRLATETTLKRKALLAENAAVYPEIEINGQKTFNGFDHVRIRPTFCVVYKSIHQPLRSLAQPEQVKFSVARTDDGHYKIDPECAGCSGLSIRRKLQYAQSQRGKPDLSASVDLVVLAPPTPKE